MRRVFVVAALAFPLAISSGPSFAGDDGDVEAARTAFKDAAQFAKQERWTEACDLYARSLALHRAAITLYSLGVAQREAGRLVEARASFRAFAAEPGTASTRAYEATVREALIELERRIPSVTVVLEPAPIDKPEVLIDGVVAKGAGLTQIHPVNPGLRTIIARAPGRVDARVQLTVVEGGTATVTLTLLREVVPLPVPSVAPLPVPASSLSVPISSVPSSLPPSGGASSHVLPLALMGAGAAVFVGGVAVGLSGVAEAHRASSGVGPDAEAARQKGIAGDILAVGGACSVGAGLIVLLTQKKARPLKAGTIAPWFPGFGLGVRSTF